jgi:hypothetical protein
MFQAFDNAILTLKGKEEAVKALEREKRQTSWLGW